MPVPASICCWCRGPTGVHPSKKSLSGGQNAAVCSGAYCLSLNLWAPAGGKADLGGLGWITDPEGNILATTGPDDPFTTVEIDLAFAWLSKRTYPRYITE